MKKGFPAYNKCAFSAHFFFKIESILINENGMKYHELYCRRNGKKTQKKKGY